MWVEPGKLEEAVWEFKEDTERYVELRFWIGEGELMRSAGTSRRRRA